jgi:hypothetical protein
MIAAKKRLKDYDILAFACKRAGNLEMRVELTTQREFCMTISENTVKL